jgi:hypothetical protein
MNTPQTPPLGDQLRALRDTGKLQVHPEVINVEQVTVGEIRITTCDDRIASRLRSLNVFFMELRRKVRILTGDDSWAIRYASQVQTPLLPILHSPHALRIIIDPMLPYRDPVKWLSDGNELSMFEIPSHAYYFMTRDALMQNENVSNKLAKSVQRREQPKAPKDGAA